jgi:hypothetical protein
MANIRIVSCAVTPLQCGFECHKLAITANTISIRGTGSEVQISALAPPAIFTIFTFSVTYEIKFYKSLII